ncbi:hypothetical protein AcV5_003880 [Taiwanofungus camphoratus]|nr:hypothetical protein AcV5_003880 [Antrodia cinnamomea]
MEQGTEGPQADGIRRGGAYAGDMYRQQKTSTDKPPPRGPHSRPGADSAARVRGGPARHPTGAAERARRAEVARLVARTRGGTGDPRRGASSRRDTGTRGNDGYTPLRSTGSNGRREKAGAARSEAGPAEKACTTITAAAAKRTRAGSELLAAGRRIGGSDGAISRRVARVPQQ